MSELKVNKVSPVTGTELTLGDSGDTIDLSATTVTLPVNSVNSDQYVDASIDNEHLADDAVNSDELAAGAVDLAHMSATGTPSASNFLRGDNSWQAAGGGKVLQVVTPAPNNTMTTLTTSWQDVGGATVTITPSLTTSKVLFMLSTGGFLQGSNGVELELLRDSTRVMYQNRFAYSQSINQSSWSYSTMNMSLHYIDSPSSTSAIVYKIRMKTQVNPVEASVNSQSGGTGTNSMIVTAMEIGV